MAYESSWMIHRAQSHSRRGRLAAAAILLALGCGGYSTGPAAGTPAGVVFSPVTVSACGATASHLLRIGDYAISTNLWGRDTITKFTECVTGSSIGAVINGLPIQTGVTARFDWDWPNVDFRVKAYPEIFWRPNGLGLQPIPFSAVGNLTVAHDVTAAATGDYNVTYDLWVDSTAKADQWPHKAELMIKLQATWNDSPVVDSLRVNGNLYDVIVAPGGDGVTAWKLIVFNSKKPLLSAGIPIKPFIDYLVSTRQLLSSDFISTVEFGSEVIRGKGSSILHSYRVTR